MLPQVVTSTQDVTESKMCVLSDRGYQILNDDALVSRKMIIYFGNRSRYETINKKSVRGPCKWMERLPDCDLSQAIGYSKKDEGI